MADMDHEILELKRRVAGLESQVAFMLRNSGFDRGQKTEAVKLFRREDEQALNSQHTRGRCDER